MGGSVKVYETVYDKADALWKGSASLRVTEHGGSVEIFGKVGKKSRARLHVNSAGDGKVSTWDKHGYVTGVR